MALSLSTSRAAGSPYHGRESVILEGKSFQLADNRSEAIPAAVTKTPAPAPSTTCLRSSETRVANSNPHAPSR